MTQVKKSDKKITNRTKSAAIKAKKTSVSRTRKTTTVTKKTAPTKKSNTKASRKVQNKKTVATSESVALPTNAGVRLQQKTEAAHDLIALLHEPVYRITYVTAFCFLAVGMFGLVTFYAIPTSNQLASTCLSGVCEDSVDTAEDTTTGSDLRDLFNQPGMLNTPELSYIEPLPRELTERVQVSLRVQHTDQVSVEVTSQNTGDLITIPVSSLSIENYRFWLDPSVLSPGQYRLTISLMNQMGVYNHIGGSFTVPLPETIETVPAPTIDPTIQNDDTQTADSTLHNDDDTTDAEDNSTSVAPTNTSSDIPSTFETNTQPETTTTVEAEAESLITPVEDSRLVETEVRNSIDSEQLFSFLEVGAVWVDREIITIQAPLTHSNIQVYVRPVNSLQALFLGTARKQQNNNWVYAFDSTNYPNGQYELFAVADTVQSNVTSDSIIIRIANTTERITTPEPPLLVEEQERDSNPSRDFYQVDVTTVDSDVTTESETEFIVERLIKDNANQINELMQRYAAAQQAEQQLLLERAEKNLLTEQARLLNQVVSDSETQENFIQVESLLQARLLDIKQRVDTFEDLRRARLAETVSQDTDGDGISDIDEVTVYNTDPNNPDSDGDTFIDGAEIVSGFNPNDSRVETIIDYELPVDVVGLARNDVLTIEAVRPVVSQGESEEVLQTFAEITGRGLPNSYVTLYVFSSPVIVTIKTEPDGTFSYRFDKELEDGEHTVYVAFTDNAGTILAHSEPFSFVKEAQAFSPVTAGDSGPAPTAPTIVESSTTNSIQFVMSLTLIVLGFFLFLLGINLRESKPERSMTKPAV